jgi:hypothetical protein
LNRKAQRGTGEKECIPAGAVNMGKLMKACLGLHGRESERKGMQVFLVFPKYELSARLLRLPRSLHTDLVFSKFEFLLPFQIPKFIS